MTDERRPAEEARAFASRAGERIDLAPSGPAAQPPPGGLGLELPERGTGARAARRAAQAAAAQRTVVERDLALRLPGLNRLRRARPDDDADANPGVVEEAPGRPGKLGPGVAPFRSEARRPPRRWLVWFTVALVACLVAASGLTLLGISTLRESRTGRTVVSAQPDEPGFEGFLEPTPTLAVRTVGADGRLIAGYVLSLGRGDVGGGVVVVPPQTLVGSGDFGDLGLVHAFNGAEAVRGAIEAVAGVGIDEMVTIDGARWAELVAPLGVVQLDNPDAVADFPAGPLELAPEEVASFLSAADVDEGPLAALVRHEVFWEAWLTGVSRAGGAAVPGELATGIGRFVRGLAAGSHRVQTLPVVEVPAADGTVAFAVDLELRAEMIVSLIPFPRGTSNAPRTLVRLLDGTGDLDHVPRVAPRVVASDASIVVVGNADRFDYETTQIRYHQPEQRVAAERLREDLGAGEVIEDVRPIDSFDVTIVLGTDL